jgi:hypothetical protein
LRQVTAVLLATSEPAVVPPGAGGLLSLVQGCRQVVCRDGTGVLERGVEFVGVTRGTQRDLLEADDRLDRGSAMAGERSRAGDQVSAAACGATLLLSWPVMAAALAGDDHGAFGVS